MRQALLWLLLLVPASPAAARPQHQEPGTDHGPLSQPATQPLPESQPAADPASDHGATRGPRDLLREAIDLYVVGRYADAAAKLRPLVEARVLRDRADQKEALRAYGISLFLSGAAAGSERAFRDLLRLDPAARLDPDFVRPEVVAFFELVRRRYQAELTDEVRRRGPRGSAAVNLLPPWGQFRNGHRTKAWLILGGELTLIASSAISAGLLYGWREDGQTFPAEYEDAAQALRVVNYASLGLLAALVVYGIVDGLYYYYRGPAETEKSTPERALGGGNPGFGPYAGYPLFQF